MTRKLYSSGAEWEDIAGYSRAVRVGNTIEVAGTTATKNGEVVGIGNIEQQTKAILEIITESVEALGGNLEDIVRTRMYVTDISQWEAVAKVHGSFFGKIKPASTMVEVSQLIDTDLLIEIEATAILASLNVI